MKSWMKFLIISVVFIALGGSWLIYGIPLDHAARYGFSMYVAWIVITLVSWVIVVFGLCILWELGAEWRSKSKKLGDEFQSWLRKDDQ